MATTLRLERRLRLAGILVILGLLVDVVCLLWAGPPAFIFLVAVGGLPRGCGGGPRVACVAVWSVGVRCWCVGTALRAQRCMLFRSAARGNPSG